MSQGNPILFLDIDDVLCMQFPYGRLHVWSAVHGRMPETAPMYAGLFTEASKAVLARVDAALQGRLRYVISSSWRGTFDREQMVTIFRAAGLPFVAERMEPGARWRTPLHGGHDRSAEVAMWLREHHRGEAYVVVDDSFSGRRLVETARRGAAHVDGRIVICDEGIGLLDPHASEILAALGYTGASQ